MDNWLAKTTQDVVFTGFNWAKNWCLTWRMLRMCCDYLRDDNKMFFRFVFVYSHSRKRNGNGKDLSVSLCGTFNRVAVHENETKKRFIVIYAISQHIRSTRHVRQWFPKIWSILVPNYGFGGQNPCRASCFASVYLEQTVQLSQSIWSISSLARSISSLAGSISSLL